MYSKYRNEILEVAKDQTNLSHRFQEHPLKGPLGESLFTDYFYSSKKQKKVLLHLSGVHGVEGYIGSLIQKEILRQSNFGHIEELPYQLVIVHAVNPYGMAWYHRTNANNVDLNRNGLKNYTIDNPHFFHFKKLLGTTNLIAWSIEFIKLIPQLLRLGKAQTIKSVASGQSDFPDCLFYSGKSLETELSSLVKNLKEIIAEDSEIYCIDVHSGLGKFGSEMLIIDSTHGEASFNFFSPCFLSPLFDPLKSKNGYPANGGMNQLLALNWDPNSVFHVFQEFGTRSFFSAIRVLIFQSEFTTSYSFEKKLNSIAALRKRMLHNFFPEEPSWRSKCVAHGYRRFQELQAKLCIKA